MKPQPSMFLVVDDDPVNNMICRVLLNALCPGSNIHTFTNPMDGLEFIKRGDAATSTLLFLDINMPEMSGWEFVDEMNLLNQKLIETLDTYILSSSIHPNDMRRAETHRLVREFVTKPLTREKLNRLLMR